MSDNKIPYIVDTTLTPTNATEKGYRFVEDVINPYEAVKDLIQLAEKEGYIFGSSMEEKASKFRIGLYHKKSELNSGRAG